MKIFLSIILMLMSVVTHGNYSPKMRNNFGANHAILRLNAGYFSNVCRVATKATDAQTPSMALGNLSNMRLSAEAMVMVNNRGNFSESVSRSRPMFMHGKASFDGFTNTTILSVGYAHGLKCQAGFLFFGQVKGYFSAGAAMRINTSDGANRNMADNVGARIGYNVYNRSSALQFETHVFQDQVLVTALAHKKLGENILINGGVENNNAKVGMSALIGSCRLSVSTQYNKSCLQSGANLTVNF